MELDKVEKLFAIYSQSVATILADMQLEIFALRQVLAERGTISQQELADKIVSLRSDKLPTLTASTSKGIAGRFWKLREHQGIN